MWWMAQRYSFFGIDASTELLTRDGATDQDTDCVRRSPLRSVDQVAAQPSQLIDDTIKSQKKKGTDLFRKSTRVGERTQPRKTKKPDA